MNWIDFSRRMLHDLTNPLLAVRLQLWNLRQSPESATAQDWEEVEAQLTKIDQLIASSRRVLKAEAPVPEKPIDEDQAKALLARLCETFPSLIFEADEKVFVGRLIAPEVLELVIKEIAKNAVESEATRLTLTSCHSSIDFTDNGRPFSRAEIEKATQPFFSGRQSRVGLGFTFAATLLESTKGRIEVTADESPKGAKVSLVFADGGPT